MNIQKCIASSQYANLCFVFFFSSMYLSDTRWLFQYVSIHHIFITLFAHSYLPPELIYGFPRCTEE